jgi:hypothetical protein
MFRALALLLTGGPPGSPISQTAAEQVLELHPMQLSRFLEDVWLKRSTPPLPPLASGVPAPFGAFESTSSIPGLPATGIPASPTRILLWRHLIYAYMIENTRAYEIFARVIQKTLYGEELGIPDPSTELWLRTTEALFYRDSPPFQIYSVTSWLRPDSRAARRNAYYRMFGMDLNHGTDDGRPYPYDKPRAANREFVVTFEEFLREVWRGVENATNTSGANPKDDATIADLALSLNQMLGTRRQSGNLNRDELWYTSMMSWFHLTLSFDTPIVRMLKAEAEGPEERLMNIAARVGLPSHSRSHSYFRMADPISNILRFVEDGQFNTVAMAPTLYMPGAIQSAMTEIISQWSLATGRDMKARKVTVTPGTIPGQPPRRAPLPSTQRPTVPAPQPNGARAGVPTT